MFGALKRGRFRSLASLILVVNVVGELQQKRTLAASRGFLTAARLSCYYYCISTLLSMVTGVVVNVCRLSVALWHNFDKEKDYDYTVFNKWLNGTLYCSFGDVKMLWMFEGCYSQ